MTSSKSFFAYTLRINKNSQDKVEVEIEEPKTGDAKNSIS